MQAISRILVVEDDPSIRALLRSLLEDTFDVSEASNGVVALVQAWDHRPDVIVLDLEMPAMGGAEAAPYLRVLSPASRIIAFSSSLSSLPLWADAFVDKGDAVGVVDLVREMTALPSSEAPALGESPLLRSAS